MARIELDRTMKVYADGTEAVRELSLDIPDGAFVVLVGPSGCGKTTALRMVAGLEDVSAGEIRIGGSAVNDVPAKDRDIAMVFQDYALYPHMTVFDNMAFSLRLRRAGRQAIREQVEGAAATLGLEDLLDKRPRALSGGQRQRVAMGRALVRSPSAFLMDEPLSNLDAKLRVQMRVEVRRLQRQVGVTTVYVTHDQVEAMTLGDLVAVMKDGQLQQVAPPEDLYRNPRNSFVAGFMGSPAMNFALADVGADGDGLVLRFGAQRLVLPARLVARRPGLAGYVGRQVLLGVRPEGFRADEVGHDCAIAVRVELREALGADNLLHFQIGGDDRLPSPAAEAVASVDDDDRARFWIATVPGRSGMREGDTVPLGIDLDELRFFDPTSGEAIAAAAD